MSKHNEQTGDAVDGAPPLTIAERIEKGRATDRHYDGAINPFPEGVTGSKILSAQRASERRTIEGFRGAGYTASVFEYRSAAGETIQAVLRFDHPNATKEIRPLIYCGTFSDTGRTYWMKAIQGQRPLYRLDEMAALPHAPVLVVEGEKTADVAAALFPEYVVTTWMSGASSVRRTEMLLLEGRNLVLWPDNDPPGRGAMRMFAAVSLKAGAASVKIVDVPSEFGEKWDLADPVPAQHAATYPLQDLLATARPIAAADVAHLIDDDRDQAEQRRLLGYSPGYSKVRLEDVETALGTLKPDMFGNEWRRVARCVFHALGEPGLAIFDAWSQGCPEKYRSGEPAKLWIEYRAEKGFRGDSVGWLFRKAAAALKERLEDGVGDLPNVEINAEAVSLAAVEELNEDHAFVIRGGKSLILWENYDPRFKRYGETYLSKRDFVDRFVRSIPLSDSDERQTKKLDKRMTQGDLWFSSTRRNAYEGVHFAPGEHLGLGYLNSWRGFAVEPADDPAGWSRFKDHLKSHVAGGDESSYNYILNWMAFAVQRMERPIGTALILIGKKGAGKSIVTELFGHLFGSHTFVTSRMDDVLGRFNERLETTVLLGLEEAVAPQNRAADGTLKDLVTRSTLRLEGKFIGVWDAPNHLRIVVTSNNEHVVRADGSDRRYAVFDVTNPHQADPSARRRYFGAIVEQMETGGYSAMLGELLARDVSSWNAEIIPETSALKRQKELNLINDPVRAYLFERLTDGINITMGLGFGTPIYRWSNTEDVMVAARHLNDDFREFAKANEMPFGERKLATQLSRYMPPGFKSETIRGTAVDDGPAPFKAYRFPPLEVARVRFEEASGILIERET